MSQTRLIALVPIAAHHYQDGAQDDFQVKQQRPIFDVEQVQLHHLFERQAIPSRHLPQSRQPRLHVESLAVP